VVAVHPYPVELSEFQLYNGAARLDAAITPTANLAPTSGSLAALKDDSTAAGVYWADPSLVPYANISLSWAFPTAVDVNGILIGHRTTAVRAVAAVMLVGSDAAWDPLAPVPRLHTVRGSPFIRFVSAAKTLVLPLTDFGFNRPYKTSSKDWSEMGGRGLITDTVKTKGTPANIPTHCKVRLLRDSDSKVIRETWTHPVTGVYTFDNFDEHLTYTVLAIHPLGSFRAVIADRLTPGLMP
jgi:hypothetical protein